MGISHRLWDDSVFVLPGEELPEPAFVGQLLARLKLEDSPVDKQIEGIKEWLRTHEASTSLKMSLKRSGFADLL
ncbi:hypothetical protein SEA_GIBBLES_73 [Gordonia phage Gibbles]|uniref:Uncharacterized protein n=3 Tax=Gordonia phage Orchid TaxID=1838075 RepID=A0A161HRQ9_9CAUD|nr:hypothetical protein BH761_gp075 [Gordonia phage Orchid]ANA87310.1 hypothetical protein PBI_PATRICKSTAR_76 [Gordonia phage PatrickStar]ANA87422.1 hypothetical protein PBI_ORCHID_75 [Gordonia phage Orchid]ANA87537.1 hypothetical protein PBI_KAMPE_76 [Gordonia phage Kampe]QDK02032.1 hypothetical protein SEA_GIBBLES_73 [Gordonia phage Gibbles]